MTRSRPRRPRVRPRLSLLDLLGESFAGVMARPGRALLTALGTVLGIGALVATLGVSQTAASQIVSRFDLLAATEVVVTPAAGDLPGAQQTAMGRVLPWDAEDRLTRLNGVRAAGTYSSVDVGDDLVRGVAVSDPMSPNELAVDVRAGSAGVIQALRGTVEGRMFDRGHSDRGDPVAVIGAAVAERLNISRVDHQPAIFIGDRLYTVIGILRDTKRKPELLHAVLIPDGTARAYYDLAAPKSVHVDTQVGAARLIAGQARVALSPNKPSLLRVAVQREPRQVKSQVTSDVNSLLLVLGGVSLLVGALGIANVTLVSVLERTGEIGLRRALGARRRHIGAQFLVESTTLGVLGGLLGASVGVLTIVAASAAQAWTPVMDLAVAAGAPVLGAFTGLLAGLYPSLRAAGLEPVEALRSGT